MGVCNYVSAIRTETHTCTNMLHVCGIQLIPAVRGSTHTYSTYSIVLYGLVCIIFHVCASIPYCTVHTVLYCTVLYCTVLYILYCTVLYSTVLYCTLLYCIVLYHTVLYHTLLYCTVLYSTYICMYIRA